MNKPEQKPKIIQVYNKQTKTTYLYEDIAYWDPKLKQGRHKRKGIGKLDANGKAVYNDYYLNRLKGQEEKKEGVFLGTTLLGENLILDRIIADTGLKETLSKTIGKNRAELALQLVRYSVCEDKPLCYAEAWLDAHGFNKSALCPQQINDLLRTLDKDTQNSFYEEWIAKKVEKKSLLFGLSSISSYARDNPYVEGGYNRSYEGLEQTNIALISTYRSNTPLWCTELPASLSDLSALEYICGHLQYLNVGKVGLFLDRDFYSKDNICSLTEKNHTFTMPVPFHIRWQNEFIDSHRCDLKRPVNLLETDDKDSIIYGMTVIETTTCGRMWVHLYYDAVRKERDIARLMKILKKCQEDLEVGRESKNREHYYEQFFEVRVTLKRVREVTLKEDEVDAYINGCSGYWVLLSTHEKDAAKALMQHRTRNDTELHFDDMKNLIDCNCLQVYSEDVMQGRLFIHFLSLIVVNELKRFVAAIPARKRNYWDHKMILYKAATYSSIHYKDSDKIAFSVPTKSQREIFNLFGIKYNEREEDSQ